MIDADTDAAVDRFGVLVLVLALVLALGAVAVA